MVSCSWLPSIASSKTELFCQLAMLIWTLFFFFSIKQLKPHICMKYRMSLLKLFFSSQSPKNNRGLFSPKG